MTRNIRVLLFLLAAACALTACVTAQQLRDQRIAANLDLFNAFTQEIQEKIRVGQVDIGFSEEMVRLAWGRPDRVYTRTTEAGETTVWTYSKTRIYTQTDRMTIPVRVRDASGRSSIRYENVWINRDTQEEYTAAQVEFSQGMVTALERVEQ